jgi:hypothetical protein
MPQPGKPASADQPSGTLDEGADGLEREMTSGRVAFDSRGNAVWEWRTGDRQFSRDVNTTLVEKLGAPDLRLQTTRIAMGKVRLDGSPGAAPAQGIPESGNYNPYNHPAADIAHRSARGQPGAGPEAPRAVKARPTKPSETPRGFVRRLQGLIGRKGR